MPTSSRSLSDARKRTPAPNTVQRQGKKSQRPRNDASEDSRGYGSSGNSGGVLSGAPSGGNLFGASSGGSLFGSSAGGALSGPPSGGPSSGGRIFGSSTVGALSEAPSGGRIFGSSTVGALSEAPSGGRIFGSSTVGALFEAPSGGSLFGSSAGGIPSGAPSGGALFGASSGGNIFGSSGGGDLSRVSSGGLFGGRESSDGVFPDLSQTSQRANKATGERENRSKKPPPHLSFNPSGLKAPFVSTSQQITSTAGTASTSPIPPTKLLHRSGELPPNASAPQGSRGLPASVTFTKTTTIMTCNLNLSPLAANHISPVFGTATRKSRPSSGSVFSVSDEDLERVGPEGHLPIRSEDLGNDDLEGHSSPIGSDEDPGNDDLEGCSSPIDHEPATLHIRSSSPSDKFHTLKATNAISNDIPSRSHRQGGPSQHQSSVFFAQQRPSTFDRSKASSTFAQEVTSTRNAGAQELTLRSFMQKDSDPTTESVIPPAARAPVFTLSKEPQQRASLGRSVRTGSPQGLDFRASNNGTQDVYPKGEFGSSAESRSLAMLPGALSERATVASDSQSTSTWVIKPNSAKNPTDPPSRNPIPAANFKFNWPHFTKDAPKGQPGAVIAHNVPRIPAQSKTITGSDQSKFTFKCTLESTQAPNASIFSGFTSQNNTDYKKLLAPPTESSLASNSGKNTSSKPRKASNVRGHTRSHSAEPRSFPISPELLPSRNRSSSSVSTGDHEDWNSSTSGSPISQRQPVYDYPEPLFPAHGQNSSRPTTRRHPVPSPVNKPNVTNATRIFEEHIARSDNTLLQADRSREKSRRVSEPVATTKMPKTSGKLIYDSSRERPKDELFFDPEIQEAIKDGKSLAGSIATALTDGGSALMLSKDSNIYKLQRRAASLRDFQSSETRTIGKSSLINSLLGIPSLAQASNSGGACTCVVTEYRQQKASKSIDAAFSIEVEFMTYAEIVEQLEEYLYNFRRSEFLATKEGSTEELRTEEFEEIRKQARLAFDTFKAAFGYREKLTKKFLTDSNDKDVMEELQKWLLDFPWPGKGEGGLWTGTAEDVSELEGKVECFVKQTQGSRTREPGIWPFTKLVRIYVDTGAFKDASILESGVVLADLPGFKDTNRARIRATEQYICRCDEIFFVAKIGRVTANESLDSMLRSGIGPVRKRLRKDTRITLVCTMIDEIKYKQDKKRFLSPEKIAELDERMTALESEQQTLDKTQKHNTKLARPTYSRAEFMSVSRLREVDNEIEALESERLQLLVSARNAEVREVLRKQDITECRGFSLQPFFVSNENYENIKPEVFRSVDALNQAIDDTGVPALRTFCHSVPAKGRFEAVEEFLTIEIPDLIGSVELWLSGNQKDGLMGDHENLFDEFKKEILGAIVSAKVIGQKKLELLLKSLKLIFLDWNELAPQVSTKWGKQHWGSYAAFCRKDGKHIPEGGSLSNWNEDLLDCVKGRVEEGWKNFKTGLDEANGGLEEVVANAFKRFEEDLKAARKRIGGGAHVTQMKKIIRNLTKWRNEVVKLLQEWRSERREKIADIKWKATTASDDSYILKLMKPTYLKILSTDRFNYDVAKATMKRELNTRGFERILDWITDDLNAILGVGGVEDGEADEDEEVAGNDDYHSDIEVSIANLLDSHIGTTFEMLKKSKGKPEVEVDKKFAKRVREMTGAARRDYEILEKKLVRLEVANKIGG